MKSVHAFVPALLTLGGLATGHLATRPALDEAVAAKQDLLGRVELLEGTVQQLRADLGVVAGEQKAQATLVDETVSYLGRQATQAEKMVSVLADSEARGFTAGINPKSREVLLDGFRAMFDEAQAGVPGAEPEPEGRGGQRAD
ncbi:MAG: hypothetical protein AAFZ65_14335 [Planctomycetota bacterium]